VEGRREGGECGRQQAQGEDHRQPSFPFTRRDGLTSHLSRLPPLPPTQEHHKDGEFICRQGGVWDAFHIVAKVGGEGGAWVQGLWPNRGRRACLSRQAKNNVP
jgi:hypothetical protein